MDYRVMVEQKCVSYKFGCLELYSVCVLTEKCLNRFVGIQRKWIREQLSTNNTTDFCTFRVFTEHETTGNRIRWFII